MQTQQLDFSRLWTLEEAAYYLGVKPDTIKDWWKDGRGPKRIKIGTAKQARVRLRPTDVVAYADCVVIAPTTTPDPPRGRGRPRKGAPLLEVKK